MVSDAKGERHVNKKQRGCLWAAAGGLVLVVVVGAAVVGGLAWLVYQNSAIDRTSPTPEAADLAFERTRARFAGQAALVTIDPGGAPHVGARDGHGRVAESLHVMSWSPDEKDLTHVKLPFWLLRLGGAKARLFTGDDALRDLRGARLSIEDIERAGPGLLLDHTENDGRRVLVWTE